jgi:hypothetical protein
MIATSALAAGGERVMSTIRRFIEGRLGLKINEAESKVDRP